MVNVGEVYFALRGTDFEPDEVTKLLGIDPSRVKRQSSPVPKYSSWELSSGKVSDEVIDVYVMGEAIVAKLSGAASAIVAAISQYRLEATLQVVLTVSPDDRLSTPAIGFSAESVQFLSAVGASIDIDTYRGAS